MPRIWREVKVLPDYRIFPLAIEIQVYAALLLKFFNQGLDERLRERGERISSLQHAILRMLQLDTLTISEISQRMGLDPSTLVRAVDALERRDLARRGSDPHDRRRHPISITDKGLQLIEAVPEITAEDHAFQALESIGFKAVTDLRDMLRELIQEFPEGKMVAELLSSMPPARPDQGKAPRGTAPGPS
jgi:DNA-binding MarR family transcriptional regulator